jgi:hypothetical protein
MLARRLADYPLDEIEDSTVVDIGYEFSALIASLPRSPSEMRAVIRIVQGRD